MAIVITSAEGDDLQERLQEHAMRLASEVIDSCRVQLMLKFRFLDLALWQMPVEPLWTHGQLKGGQGYVRFPGQMGRASGTDAVNVYCEPFGMLGRYIDAPDEAVRDHLHLVMHCIFGHPFDTSHSQTALWWLACDVMAESSCMDICGARFPSTDDAARRWALSQMTAQLENLTPARLYDLFTRAACGMARCGQIVLDINRLAEWAALFARDDHWPWPGNPQRDEGRSQGSPQEVGKPQPGAQEDDEQPGQQAMTDPEGLGDMQDASVPPQGDEADDEGTLAPNTQADEGEHSDKAASDGAPGGDGPEPEEPEPDEGSQDTGKARARWSEIAQRVQTDLETFSREWGDAAGSLVSALAIANRQKVDYDDFLRRFAVFTEDIKVNLDEFDLVFYTYGLDIYGDMPLVEPLEYRESKRIRSFVIAIDTSGSVRGELVKRFVQHTFEILKESEAFEGGRVDIHIVQCDARVQSDVSIANLDELGEYLDDFEVKGFGGTDFRPVFEHVAQLIEQGQLEDMRGLIYFTDGLGTYPQTPVPYEVAFVFVDEGDPQIPDVPPWAMRVMIDEQGLRGL